MNLILTGSSIEAAGIQTFYFKPEQPVDYIAGQFMELTLPHTEPDGQGIRRWFTLSSSPTEELLAVTMRMHEMHTRQSSFKCALQQLQPGQSTIMSDLLGDFVLPLDGTIPLVWVAGGIGITPFRSMAKWMADTGEKREITLFHSTRNQNENIFDDILDAAGIELHRHVGSAKQSWLATPTPDTDSTLYYISGPEVMTSALSHLLQTQGINSQRIITDAFLGY